MDEDLRSRIAKTKSNDPSLEYFHITGRTVKGLDIYTCQFCQTSLTRKITRFNEHLLVRCKDITPEAKEYMKEQLPDGVYSRIQHRGTPGRAKRRARNMNPYNFAADNDEIVDDNDDLDDGQIDYASSTQQAVQLLTGLLGDVTGALTTDTKPPKRLADMSMEELEREEKISAIKLARAKLEKIKESIAKYQNLNASFDVVVQATQGMIEQSKSQLSTQRF